MNQKQQIQFVKQNRDLASLIMNRMVKLEINLEVLREELQIATQLIAELSDDLGGQAVNVMRNSK